MIDSSTPPKTKSAWEMAREYGCDMSLLELNLRSTLEELLARHDRAARAILTLRNAEKRT